jgi:TetR/AcrR family transcriptional repressor of lmrAB and yxaGH operons
MPKQKKTKGEVTREKLVAVAADLFQVRGFHAIGLNEICAAGELPKGSVYYHFPKGKEEIAIAVIEAAQREIAVQLEAAAEAANSIGEFMQLVAAGFGHNLTNSNFTKGCPITTINLEMASESEPIRMACAQAFEHWISICANRLEQEGMASPYPKAEFMFATIEGAMVLARAQKSTLPIERAATQLNSLFA